MKNKFIVTGFCPDKEEKKKRLSYTYKRIHEKTNSVGKEQFVIPVVSQCHFVDLEDRRPLRFSQTTSLF